ncbi:hypothetical protein Tdes44962_MAKER06327 [Teratosphaeria destructans]|uniref:HNH nuclease domain-containing protein n=1 Tax=Teratosphaeria destructans TaxID=418781 RepID=A0A9W7VXQ9_9PEZI|nr:hypothetical protein Tdes44962_MAKER06327 [Teratosphaeria destructans]
MPLPQLLPPLTSPLEHQTALLADAAVRVRHPGYPPDDNNLLVHFAATDISTDGVQGVTSGIVHCACAIVANNRFDGFLSASQDYAAALQNQVSTQQAGHILPAGDYYFHVPRPDPEATSSITAYPLVPWPVVPNFREWRFPTDQELPAPWLHAAIAPSPVEPGDDAFAAKIRDGSCRVTQHTLALRTAHLVPALEQEWFMRNAMGDYRPSLGRREKVGIQAIDDADNTIMLRADVHLLFDSTQFSIVPKQADTGEWRWTLHACYTTPEVCSVYHNRQLQPLVGICRQYLFARFASDIFPRLAPFFHRSDVARWVVTRDGNTDKVSGSDCFQRFCVNQGRGRSSPSRASKRKMKETNRGEEGDAADSGVGSFAEESSGEEEDGVKGEGNDVDIVSYRDDPFGNKRRAHQQARLDKRLQSGFLRSSKRGAEWDSDEGSADEARRGRKRYRYLGQIHVS